MVTSPVRTIIESFYPKIEVGSFCPSITPPCTAAPHIEIPRPSPVRELGERLAVPVSSMEMKPEVAAAPTPTMVPTMEKCVATLPVQGIATSVSVSGPIETATPKPSLTEHVEHFLWHGFSNVGDSVMGEEPLILLSGKDYLMGDRIQQESAAMEGKVAVVAAAAIPAVKKVYTAGKLVAKGVEAAAKAIDSDTPGGLTFATPHGPTVTGALEAVPAAVGVGEGIGVETVTTAITGSDLPLSMSLKQEKVPRQRDISNAGTSGNLKDGIGSGGFQDGKEIHHIVPQRYLKRHGIPEEDGLSVILPREIHQETNTYGGKAKDFDLDQSFRDATAEGIRDIIRVEKDHGAYENPGRKNLIKGLEEHKKTHPEWYEKGDTK
jgi:hypothetical protein